MLLCCVVRWIELKINNFFVKFSRRASRSGKVPLSSSGSGASGVGGGGGGPSGAGGGVATSSGSGAAMDGTGTDGSAPHSSGGAIPPNASAPSSSSVPTGETIRVKFTSSARPLKRGNPHIDVWLQNSKHFTFRLKKNWEWLNVLWKASCIIIMFYLLDVVFAFQFFLV